MFHHVAACGHPAPAQADRAVEERLLSIVLMTVSSDEFVAEASQAVREGSKMPRADWKLMKQYPRPRPPDGLLESFNAVTMPTVAQLRVLSFQNRKLVQARDLLLPRLMSGELAA